MADNVGEIYYSVEARTDALVMGERQANQSLDRLQKGFDETDRSAERLGGGLTSLANIIKTVIAASVLRDIAGMVQGYQEMEDRIRLATKSADEFRLVQDRLLATANGTYRSLTEAQELYVLTADTLRGMGYTLNQAIDVQDSLSYAFVRNATNAERANNAIQAVTSSLNKGKVEADNWGSIMAAIPTVVKGIADASGKSEREIRALGAAGKITAQQLSEGLRKSLDENTKAAAGMTNNLRDAGVRVRTAFTQMFVTVENQTGVLQGLTDSIIKSADVLLAFGQNSDAVSGALSNLNSVVTVLAAVYAARLVGAASEWVMMQGRLIAGAVAQNQADTAAAAAAVRRTAIERQVAAAAVATAAAEYEAAKGTNAHTFAANALTAARERSLVAVNAHNAALQRQAGIATAGTVAMNGLRGAMALLGGPAGVITLAAIAIGYFATKASEARVNVDELNTSLGKLTINQLNKASIDAAKDIEDLSGKIRGAQNKLTGNARPLWVISNEGWEEYRTNLKADIDGMQQQIDARTELIKKIDEQKKAVADNGGKPTGSSAAEPPPVLLPPTVIDDGKAEKEAEKAAKALRQKIDDLQLEADMLGMTATEQELYKLQLAGATDEQIRSAATSLALIEAYKAQTKAAEDLADAEQKKRDKFGGDSKEAAKYIQGDVDPLSGGEFDNQYARYEAEAKAENERYQAQLDRLKVAKEMRIEVLGGYQALEEQMTKDHGDRIAQIEAAKNSMILTSASSMFESLAGGIKAFAGESSGAYKAMFITAKAFAIADAGLKLSSAVAQAMADPTALTPAQKFANMAAVAAAGANVISQISSVAFAGRANGGPVQAGNMYRINEGGAPEVFNAANGQQFMLPNQRGEVVSNKDASGGASNINYITISVDSGGNVQTNAGASTTQSVALAQAIRVVVVDEIERQSRQNGILWKMNNGQY